MNNSKYADGASVAVKENGAVENDTPGLEVVIIGAGIAGLFAALSLRQQGHHVEVYEKSHFTQENGAAVHVTPNAYGLLKRLGIDLTIIGANQVEQVTEYDMTGKVLRTVDVASSSEMWQHKWLIADRVRFHEALKSAATAEDGPGLPVKLHLATEVIDVDPELAQVTLRNGSVVVGDVLLGADGVRSVCRARIPGVDADPLHSGKSAFRFSIDRLILYDDLATRHFVERTGEIVKWNGTDRRIVMCPTRNNTLLDFVCIHPAEESAAGADWTSAAKLDTLLAVYKTFDESTLVLLRKANPESLEMWDLLDMPQLPTLIHGSMALLGDAAHPFLHHQGEDAGIAIEDAAALSVVLERGLDKNEVRDRLKLYEQIRHERAHQIQEYSRLAGRGLDKGAALDTTEYTNYTFGHDEFDNSAQKLREWRWAKTPNVYWRMPISFGPMPGPRQTHDGRVRQASESTFLTASIKFKTSRTVLQNLLPPGINNSMRFTSPGSVAYCSFSCTSLDKMEWLGGSGYNHHGLYIHGVECEASTGEIVKGTYLPILFESLADPIISGREELGMPKLYSSIDCSRSEISYHVRTGWQGSMWGSFQLHDLEPVSPSALASDGVSSEHDANILAYRYLPKVGRASRGQSEAEYPVFVDSKREQVKPKISKAWESKNASIDIDSLGWDALPTLHHVVSRLKEIPVYEVVRARLVEGTGVPDVGAAERV